ncbi:MAG: hypothetical protein E7292_12270 [Lachnospiraceae bacterium]|nr:hypothetical protein [Lachnospiraceae bacterium]
MAKNFSNAPNNKGQGIRKALFTSIISMLVCVAMILGTTMAWFTALTTNSGNRIQTGDLDVELYKYENSVGEYQLIIDGDDKSKDIFSNSTLWEPGKTEYVLLMVKNAGNLAMDYNVELSVGYQNKDNLANISPDGAFMYAVVPGMNAESAASQIKSWEDIRGTAGAVTGSLLQGLAEYHLGQIEKANGEDYFLLAVHMNEDAGNEYMNQDYKIQVRINAKQMSYEKDSFDNQYDAYALWTETLDISAEVTSWNAKLAAEDAVSKHEPPTSWRDPITAGENLIKNGNFTDGIEIGWDYFHGADYGAKAQLITDGYSGNALRLTDTTSSVYKANGSLDERCIWQTEEITVDDSTWEDEYQLSYYYRQTGGNTNNNYVMIYFWKDNHELGQGVSQSGIIEQAKVAPSAVYTDGQWRQVYGTFIVPKDTKYIEIVPMVNKSKSSAIYDYDEFVLYKTGEGGSTELSYNSNGIYALETDGTFFYNDTKSTDVSVEILDMDTYSELASGSVEFRLYDGEKCIWYNGGNKVAFDANGVALVTLNFEELQGLGKFNEINTPYCLKATVFDVSTTELWSVTKELFLFERPAYLSAEGKFTKFGEDFNPIVGYHVQEAGDDMAKAAQEGGVNVVQLGYRKDAETVLAQLDLCAKNGVKGLVCLYYGMNPAGHENNLAYTIDIVSDPRIQNHEALFGYCTMDEPFLNIKDANEARELIIQSYRLIRQYDQDNLIVHMENHADRFEESVELVDALLVDSYKLPAGAPIYSFTAQAKAAVGESKPLWTLLMSFDYSKKLGGYIDADGLRNNNWQALLAGSEMVGYFSISDAGTTPVMDDGNTAIWEMSYPDDPEAGAKLWAGICEFNDKEKEIAYDHFVRDEGTTLSKDVNIEGGYISYSWADKDGKVYVILLNVKGSDVTVNVDLENADSSAMTDFTANVIAGRSEGDTLTYTGTDGKLSVNLTGVEAVLFRVQ